MARYGMVIDISKCTGCYNCFLTCRDEFAGNDYAGYAAAQPMTGMNWMRLVEKERGQYPKVKVAYTPVTCMQCDDPGCMKVAQGGAVYRRADGIIIIDPEKAKGQKQIVGGCPYRAIEWNEEKQLPQKCILCAHMLDKGEKVPRCVESCPTGALIFGDLDDPGSVAAKLIAGGGTEALHEEYKMKEKVRYLNLPKTFIAGTVILGDVDEVARGAVVKVEGEGGSREARTNGFGDFEFEGLAGNSDYKVKVEMAGYKPRNLKVKTQKDTYMGEIVLKK